MAKISKATDCITRMTCLCGEEKPKRHKIYQYYGKVGTTSTVVIFIPDKEEIKIGDYIEYLTHGEADPFDKKSYFKYPNWHGGVVDKINEDGYIFVQKF